jgi:hypothetical protein
MSSPKKAELNATEVQSIPELIDEFWYNLD